MATRGNFWFRRWEARGDDNALTGPFWFRRWISRGDQNLRIGDFWFRREVVAGDVGGGGEEPPPTEAPEAPANLAAAATGTTTIELTWDASEGATSYNIYRDEELVGSTAATSFVDTDLTHNTQYAYTVTAENAAGESANSDSDAATTWYAPVPVFFEGTDNLLRGGALTGAPTSAAWTLSFWFRRTGGQSAERFIIGDTTATWRFRAFFRGSSIATLRVEGRGAGPTTQIQMDTQTAFLTGDEWHHCLACSDGSAEGILIDGVSNVAVNVETGGTVQFAQNSEWGIGCRSDAANDYIGDIADLMMWQGAASGDASLFIDPATRRAKPPSVAIAELGDPIVQQTNALASWHTNVGTGGGFTVTAGELSAGQSPVQYPNPVTQTEFEAPSGEGDGIALVDIGGLPSVVYVQQDGTHFLYTNSPAGTFTESTIRGSTVASAKFEGIITGTFAATLADDFEVYSCDQENDDIWAHTQDTPGTPSGTWTGAIINTAVPFAQNMRALTINGTKCLLCAYEGAGAGQGGIVLGTLAADGDPLEPTDWTFTVITQIEGAWWIDDAGLRTFDGDQVLFFSVRNDASHNPAVTAPGAYYLTVPAGNLHTTWTRTQIHTSAVDWLHIASGDFFGNGVDTDVAIHGITGAVKLFDSSDEWAATDVTLATTVGQFNLRNTGLRHNGRDVLLATGTADAGLLKWMGHGWELERWALAMQKTDGPILIADVDDDGTDDFILCDSLEESIYWVDGSAV